jgi:hypothetical protein
MDRTLEAGAGGSCRSAPANLLDCFRGSSSGISFEICGAAAVFRIGTARAVPARETGADEKHNPSSEQHCQSIVSASPAEKSGTFPGRASANAGKNE